MTDTEEHAVYRALSNWESASISRCLVLFAGWRRIGCGDKVDTGNCSYDFTYSIGRYEFTDNPVRFINANWVYKLERKSSTIVFSNPIKSIISRKALR